MRFEIYRQASTGIFGAAQGTWRWRLKAGNGEIIASGEGYHNRADCMHAIGLVKQASMFTPIQDVNF